MRGNVSAVCVCVCCECVCMCVRDRVCVLCVCVIKVSKRVISSENVHTWAFISCKVFYVLNGLDILANIFPISSL